eukprot:g30338.t1
MHGPLEVFSLATIRALGTSFLGVWVARKRRSVAMASTTSQFNEECVGAVNISEHLGGCFKFFQKLCKGDCQPRQDMWVDQCLKRFVKARRLFEKNLLLEDHCDPPKGWKDCSDPRRVAFHPFKTDAWRCLARPTGGRLGSLGPMQILPEVSGFKAS